MLDLSFVPAPESNDFNSALSSDATVLSLIKTTKNDMEKDPTSLVQRVKRNTPRRHLFFGAGPPTERPLVFFAAASSSFSF